MSSRRCHLSQQPAALAVRGLWRARYAVPLLISPLISPSPLGAVFAPVVVLVIVVVVVVLDELVQLLLLLAKTAHPPPSPPPPTRTTRLRSEYSFIQPANGDFGEITSNSVLSARLFH